MSKMHCRSSLILVLSGLVLVIKSWAGIPVWTFTRVAGYPPVISVNAAENKIIKYKVINQSRRMHILRMRPIPGITSTGCTQPLYYHGSCTLSLQVRGSTLKGGGDWWPSIV